MYFGVINEDTSHEKISLCVFQPDFLYGQVIVFSNIHH